MLNYYRQGSPLYFGESEIQHNITQNMYHIRSSRFRIIVLTRILFLICYYIMFFLTVEFYFY